ncbi:MAG: LPS export ABC transporter periplasmic protein LptC [Pseudomonadota bacterium]
MNTRGWIALLALAATAMATWLLRGDRDTNDETPVANTPVERGYYMIDAHIFGTDDDGELLYELMAQRALQTASREPIELSGIRVDYAAGNGRWQIEANSATLEFGGSQLALSGQVVARRDDDGTVGAVAVHTETLAFNPEARTVETDDTVRFEIGEGTLVATGMLALLDEDRIELRSNIRGQFTP